MTRRRLAAVCVGGVLATTVVWAGLGPGRPDPPRGKSGSGEALVLRLAAADGGAAARELAGRFARRVRELSRGSLRVAVSYQPPAAAVGSLRAREAELAIVPADSFRVLGVTSLEALQAPFLISSSTHAARATAGLIAERLQAGLGELSLSGLALVPDGLYRAFGYLKALETPGDYADVTIRAPPSVALFDLLRALGARAVPLGVEGETVVYDGFDGPATRTAEDAFPENAYTAGNLALLPQIEAIVGSTDALGRLSAGQRAIVDRAAEQVRRRTIAAASEQAAASAFCAAGGTVVTAPGQSLRVLRASTASLLAALRRDPTTRVLVSAIARLAPAGRDALAPCGPVSTGLRRAASPGEYVGAASVPHPPVGTFRRAFTAAELRAAGASEAEAERNAGVTGLTFYGQPYGRRFVLEWPGESRPPCRGSVEYPGRRIELRWWPETPCRGYVAFSWRNAGRGDFAVVAVDPRSEPGWIRRVYPGTWKRVDCEPYCGSRGRLSSGETAELFRRDLPGRPAVICHSPASFPWDYECYVPGGGARQRFGVNVDAHGITETSRR